MPSEITGTDDNNSMATLRMIGGGKSFARRLAVLVLLEILRAQHSGAQTVQTLPEVDAYVKVNPSFRFNFQAKETKEGGDPTQAEIGPSLDFYIKPLVRLQNPTEFELDDSKSRFTVISIGYRYMPQANGVQTINRMEPVVTFHSPAEARFLLSDKNRADLDWQGGDFTWRYRNRFQIERVLQLGAYHPVPYASAEFFYESQYQKWSDTAIYAGCVLPIGKRFQLDTYYEHQNNTGKRPNQQLNQVGLVLNVYFLAK